MNSLGKWYKAFGGWRASSWRNRDIADWLVGLMWIEGQKLNITESLGGDCPCELNRVVIIITFREFCNSDVL